MSDVYLICLVIGAAVLVVQTVVDLAGWGAAGAGADVAMSDGLDLLSVRTLSAGATLFGAVGLWLNATGLPVLLSAPVALASGAVAAVATAYITRQMLRLESDGTVRVANALGQAGTVYLTVPPQGEGHGLVQCTVQGRTVELRAVATDAHALPTGTPVIVVAVLEDSTVEVTRTPLIEGIDA